ncbi:hypothetical protein [Pontibacter oryzae]|uniref:Uncharacterized protein n=1 Tax=Pontibacter oryzae TaxID=2304593 RepID=A0A399S6A7_9BACT|nr:hypothetical protein [Pontibacter oryzae]RIJ37357.1 hypothetical protein D1627_09470 [Pontibacter oryzae]
MRSSGLVVRILYLVPKINSGLVEDERATETIGIRLILDGVAATQASAQAYRPFLAEKHFIA